MTPSSQKEALQYLVEEASQFDPVVDIDGVKYARDRKGELRVPPAEPKGTPVRITTLSGLRDFIVANVDGVTMQDHLLLIQDERSIVLKGPRVGRHKEREILADCVAPVPCFKFGEYLSHEEFNIALQAQFEHTDDDDRNKVLSSISKMKSGTEIQQEDDGVTQRAVESVGVALGREMHLPNPVRLSPWRTFSEVRQPTSLFILRAQPVERGVRLALFEADGGRWREEARALLKKKLEGLLDDLDETELPHLIV